jgi:hypothetical protein
MKLLLVDVKELNLFFQAEIEDGEKLSELMNDGKMKEMLEMMNEIKVENEKLLKQKKLVRAKLESLIKDVNAFNEKHNEGYKAKEVRIE